MAFEAYMYSWKWHISQFMLNFFQWHNGINLSIVKAPPKEPQKCALQLMDKLFSRQELSEGILFQSKRSSKPPLDEVRVTKMFGKFICYINVMHSLPHVRGNSQNAECRVPNKTTETCKTRPLPLWTVNRLINITWAIFRLINLPKCYSCRLTGEHLRYTRVSQNSTPVSMNIA